MANRYSWRQLAEVVERIEREKETAIVEGPNPAPPMERLPRVWHAFVEGRYVGTGQSADHAEGIVRGATAGSTRVGEGFERVMGAAVREAQEAGVPYLEKPEAEPPAGRYTAYTHILTPKAREALHTTLGLARGKVLVAHMLLALLQVQEVNGGLLSEVAAAEGIPVGRLQSELQQEIGAVIHGR